jgi:hypothetical protein
MAAGRGGMQYDLSLQRRVVSDSLSDRTRFRQSRPGRQKHPGVPDGN